MSFPANIDLSIGDGATGFKLGGPRTNTYTGDGFDDYGETVTAMQSAAERRSARRAYTVVSSLLVLLATAIWPAGLSAGPLWGPVSPQTPSFSAPLPDRGDLVWAQVDPADRKRAEEKAAQRLALQRWIDNKEAEKLAEKKAAEKRAADKAEQNRLDAKYAETKYLENKDGERRTYLKEQEKIAALNLAAKKEAETLAYKKYLEKKDAEKYAQKKYDEKKEEDRQARIRQEKKIAEWYAGTRPGEYKPHH